MERVIGRYRNMTVLAVILFVQVIGLAVQVKRPADPAHPDSEPTRLLRIWANSVVNPFEEVLVDTSRFCRQIWQDYLDLRGVRRQNQQLQAELDRIRVEQARLTEDAAQARRLQALLQFKEQFVSQTVAAQVIGTSGSELSRVITVDKGSRDGVAPDMPVITPGGIVGKVLRVFPGTAQVLEIGDQSSGVGALLEKSRLQGIVKGSPSGEPVLSYIMRDENVQPGERVLTSGGDRVFPKGLLIGTVAEVTSGRDLFYRIRIKPAADLDRLEEVLVITRVEDRAPEQEAAESGPMRAADILASRLPSVTPKAPPENAAAGSRAASGAASTATGTTAAGTASATKPTPPRVPASKPAAAPGKPATGAAPPASGSVQPAAQPAAPPATPPAATTPPATEPQPNPPGSTGDVPQ